MKTWIKQIYICYSKCRFDEVKFIKEFLYYSVSIERFGGVSVQKYIDIQNDK